MIEYKSGNLFDGAAHHLDDIGFRGGIPDGLLRYIPKVPARGACKVAAQPTGFVFDPLQDLDRILARAKAKRAAAITAGLHCFGRWVADWWLGALVFALLVGALFAFHGHWSTSVWMETIQ